jgi:hypothetical protein
MATVIRELTNPVDQILLERHVHGVSAEIPRRLRNKELRYRIDKNPPLDSILNHLNLVHTLS